VFKINGENWRQFGVVQRFYSKAKFVALLAAIAINLRKIWLSLQKVDIPAERCNDNALARPELTS